MNSSKSETGLTIIEALIAMLILGMIVSSLMLVNQQSFKITNESKIRTTAINLARERIESLKYLDCNDPANQLTRSSVTWLEKNGATLNKPIKGIDYTVITTIPNTSTTNNYFKDNKVIPLRITVQWQINGVGNSISLDTCYTQY